MNQTNAVTQLQIARTIAQEARGAVKKYWIETFGCQMNERDSETLAGLIAASGYTAASEMLSADLILFNTCCVREHAEQRVYGNIGALKQVKDERPELVLGVCGCMMQQDQAGEKLFRRFPFVNLVFGTHMLPQFCQLLYAVLQGERVLAVSKDIPAVMEGLPSVRASGVSTFVNINFGCDNYCTYCIVPYVRGPERSRCSKDIVHEVLALAENGCTEVTLLGQNVNSYGHDLPDENFASLLGKVNAVPGIRRIRFMTSHPKDLTAELIDAIARYDKVCHHVHLPAQSGSDSILSRMNRKYTRAHYLDTVARLRQAVPDVEITTDIIVGFPGETETDFLDTLDMVRSVGFASAFTFKYSPRAGTAAARMADQVEEAVKSERLYRLNALQEQITSQRNTSYIGQVSEVLIEGYDQRQGLLLFGKTNNFKMVYFPGNPDRIGQYVSVRITGGRRTALTGEMEELI